MPDLFRLHLEMLPAYASELEPTGILEDWGRAVELFFSFSAVDLPARIFQA